jgi:XTP/dITP diphosphohydrolase
MGVSGIMKLYFATQNKHKLQEAQAVLGRYGVEVEQLDVAKQEDKDASIQEVAKQEAKRLAEEYRKPVMVDDTGVFFSAYKNFPGAHPKLMFESLGFEGLLKLLEGKSRDAYFLCCVAYCSPGGEVELFEGRLDCVVAEEVVESSQDVMPYERILLFDGTALCLMSREEKNKISHRAKAFEELAEWLEK